MTTPKHESYRYSYAWEKFYQANDTLCGRSSQEKRLEYAIQYLLRLQSDDVPDEMRDDFVKFMEQFTKVNPVGDEGSIAATIPTMDEMRVRGCVEKINSWYSNLSRQYGQYSDGQF